MISSVVSTCVGKLQNESSNYYSYTCGDTIKYTTDAYTPKVETFFTLTYFTESQVAVLSLCKLYLWLWDVKWELLLP